MLVTIIKLGLNLLTNRNLVRLILPYMSYNFMTITNKMCQ